MDLREGGYPRKICQEIFPSAITGSIRIWKADTRGDGYLTRPGHCTSLKRKAKKINGYTCYKKIDKIQRPNPYNTA